MDAAKTIRALIRDEISRPRPNFAILDTYIRSFKEVTARAGKLSIADAGKSTAMLYDADEDGVGITIGTNAIAYGEPISKSRRHDSWEDQMLATLAAVAQRSAPDPFIALLQALPNVESLYPEGEREALRQQVRTEVDRRLKKQGHTPGTPTIKATNTIPSPIEEAA